MPIAHCGAQAIEAEQMALIYCAVSKSEALDEKPDDIINPLGIKGVGEIGIVGVAAAIAKRNIELCG